MSEVEKDTKALEEKEGSVIDVDENPDNANWLRGMWPWPDVGNAKQLNAKLKALGITKTDFKRSTIYRVNREKLDWLKGY